MGLPSFIKIHKYRKFNYQPLYYNERKEELDKRISHIKSELGVDETESINFQSSIRRGQMKGYIQKAQKVNRQSNIRLVVILGMLFLLFYLIFYTNIF